MVAGGYVKRDYTDNDNERKHPQNITASSVPLSILDLSTSGSQSLTLTYTHEYITPAQRQVCTGTGTTLVVFKDG